MHTVSFPVQLSKKIFSSSSLNSLSCEVMSACKYVLQAKICFHVYLCKMAILKEIEQDVFCDQISSLTIFVCDAERTIAHKHG